MTPWTGTRYLLHITTASDKPYPAQMTVDEQTFERVVADIATGETDDVAWVEGRYCYWPWGKDQFGRWWNASEEIAEAAWKAIKANFDPAIDHIPPFVRANCPGIEDEIKAIEAELSAEQRNQRGLAESRYR